MRVVIDTNILVSAMLTPGGTAWQVLSSVLTNRLRLLVDERILAEYEEVLQRRKFQLNSNDVIQLCSYLADNSEHILSEPVNVQLEDPDDAPFVEVALSGHANFLITGNVRHYPNAYLRRNGVAVVTPSQFLKQKIQ